ncbi:MAG: single-stranded DNA-binding protein [Pseudomonadota bacterium]
MQSLTIAGRIGKDAELRSTQSSQVCGFSVAVDQGFGDSKKTNWYRCSLWGNRGEKLSRYLLKGVPVTVSGQLAIGEYEGKPQFDIRVDEITLQGKREGGQQSGGGGHAEQQHDELSDDVPFILAISDTHERRCR